MYRLNTKRFFFALLLIIILTPSNTNIVKCENSQADAKQSILAAEDQNREAFASIRMAEENGAEVKDLIGELNAALNLTLDANTQFREGDFSEAIILASNAIAIAEEVSNHSYARAEIGKQQATSTLFLRKYGTIAVFVITDVIICLVGVFLIHTLIRRSLMKKRPKLVKV